LPSQKQNAASQKVANEKKVVFYEKKFCNFGAGTAKVLAFVPVTFYLRGASSSKDWSELYNPE